MKKLNRLALTASMLSVLLAVLTGCGNWITEANIKKAEELCKENGGIKHLSIFIVDKAVCKNDAIFHGQAWIVSDS